MNSDDFRRALHDHVGQQPPVSPDLRAGVDRQVRRQRLRAIAVASPAVVVLLLGAALLLPRGGQETTLSVADGGTGTTAVTTTAPAPTTVTVPSKTTEPDASSKPTTTAPATTEPGATATTVTTAASGTPKDPVPCGQVEISTLDPTSLPTGSNGPFACFIKAFNAGAPTDLAIIVHGPDGGTLTEKLSATADHRLTVTANGSMAVKLPAFNLGGGGGGLVPDDSTSAGECGTITVDLADKNAEKPDAKVLKCLMAGFMGGRSAHVTFVMHDAQGGTMTSSITLSGTDHVVTVTMDGTTTVKLPDHLKVPEDVLNAVPSGHMGLNGMMGGLGGLGGTWGGGDHDTTPTTDK